MLESKDAIVFLPDLRGPVMKIFVLLGSLGTVFM
jgi:hypothetical protein